MKWDTTMIAGATPASDDDGFWADGDSGAMPFVAISDMSRRDRVTSTSKALTAEGLASRNMPVGTPGTLLLAMYASVGEVAFLDIEATWNQALLGITVVGERVDARFLRYVLLDQRDDLLSEVRSNTQANLNASQVGNLWFQRPPVAEQRVIADFLDRETARIDELITEQKRLIELLDERRQAAIDREFSDQSVPTVQLRHLSRLPIDAGVDAQSDASNPSEWPTFLRTTDMVSLTDLDPSKRVTVSPDVAGAAPLRRNDIVLTRAGATIGKSFIYLHDDPACYAGYLVRVRFDPEVVLPMFGAYWTVSTHFMDQVATGAVKSTIENFSASKYRAVRIPVPLLGAQADIVNRLDRDLAQLDSLAADARRLIELARERRSALIAAAVTGLIDVQSEVAS